MNEDAIVQAAQDLRYLELVARCGDDRTTKARFRQVRSVIIWAMAARAALMRLSVDGPLPDEDMVQLMNSLRRLL